ncbi:hypothetical protein EJ03DRAFT_338833 [Teratosphaeria nubilosa]|uniref:Uncharacterized protein n=1 Tax=Teratosphaeria nubilosa TaxID=161662 RepID=A0A6G1KYM4_9PEZI|nr:hypothetical protein EJ03DRAFT_338833 [Teratosphaeria nubilosa]
MFTVYDQMMLELVLGRPVAEVRKTLDVWMPVRGWLQQEMRRKIVEEEARLGGAASTTQTKMGVPVNIDFCVSLKPTKANSDKVGPKDKFRAVVDCSRAAIKAIARAAQVSLAGDCRSRKRQPFSQHLQTPWLRLHPPGRLHHRFNQDLAFVRIEGGELAGYERRLRIDLHTEQQIQEVDWDWKLAAVLPADVGSFARRMEA